MGILTFGLNVTLDGCVDHRVGIADDETHAHFTALMGGAGAMLWGRTTYELMEDAWPDIAAGRVQAPPALVEWALALEAKPKYVVSSTRTAFPWANSHHLAGAPGSDVATAVLDLKAATPDGVLLGSGRLGLRLHRLGLIDEYRLLIHPVIAGHGPRLFDGAEQAELVLLESRALSNGCLDVRYRRA